jgi:hypothetical protein
LCERNLETGLGHRNHRARVGRDVVRLVVVGQLPGQLSEGSLRKLRVVPLLEVAEGNELHDVPRGSLSRSGSQQSIIRVEVVHVLEVGITHADDDDGEGKIRGVNDLLDAALHVGNDSVGDHEEDPVDLLLDGGRASDGGDLLDDGAKVGRARQLDVAQRMLVGADHVLDTDALGVAGVHVDVEAVRDFVGRRDLGAETIGGELLGLVVGGDDVTDSHDGLQVLVGLARWVAVVKRLGVLRVAVGGGEVDGKRQAQLASTSDVLEERVDAADVDLVDIEYSRILVASLLTSDVGFDQRKLPLALEHLVQRGLSVTDEVVAAIGIPIKHLEQQRPVKVAPAQLRCVDFECPP